MAPSCQARLFAARSAEASELRLVSRYRATAAPSAPIPFRTRSPATRSAATPDAWAACSCSASLRAPAGG